LANGNVCVAIGYSGDIYQAKARAEEAGNQVTVKYNIPKEGAGTFFDMLAVPADAKNVDSAHVFLNYLMKPEVMASITDYVQFPNGNAAATPLVDEAIRTDPGIYPSQAVLQKLYTFPDLDPKTQRTMTRSWTKIKSGR
jgi:putrescine transport system substrate-binding protein